MKAFYGFCMASVTFAFGHLAWILTMTDSYIGGWLPWAMITLAPGLFYGLGYFSSSAESEDDWEHIVLSGNMKSVEME